MTRSPPPTMRVAFRPFTDTDARSRRDGGVRSCPEPSLYDFAGMAALTGTCSSPPGEGRWPLLHMRGGLPTARANYALFSVHKKVRSSPATRSGSPVLSGARCPTPRSSTRRTWGRVVCRASSVRCR